MDRASPIGMQPNLIGSLAEVFGKLDSEAVKGEE